MAPERLRIIVGGFLGLLPAGGVTWDYLQYPLGLLAMGHDVFYVEDTGLWPIYQSDDASSASNVRHLQSVMDEFGMSDRWAYRDAVSSTTFGIGEQAVAQLCQTADVFINLSCSTMLRDEHARIPVRILIDTDPMFTQIQHETQSGFTAGSNGMRELVAGHTHLFTFGENVGAPDCLMPHESVTWTGTRQPICIEQWSNELEQPDPSIGFSTVMNWTAGRPLEYAGDTWGQKDVEFLKMIELPRRVNASVTVAVGQTGGTGKPFPFEAASRAGWRVENASVVAENWKDYRSFIHQSAGEFSVAKETYVKARTGWFSCRSACYLASGRPVITQDTGWSRHIAAGNGLIAFDSLDEAAAGIETILTDLRHHSTAAREIAAEYFDAPRVLGAMLREAGAA